MPAPKDPVAYALWKQRMSEARKGEKNSNYGKHLSEEHKTKISKTRIERGVAAGKNNPMYDVHLPGYWKGKKMPEEARKKISEAMAGKHGHPMSEQTKEKIHEALAGKPKSEEHKRKLRDAHLGKPSWNKGKYFSEESKKKMSEAKLGKSKSGEFCQKRSEIMTERWKDPEFKKDMSEKHSGENHWCFGKQMSEESRTKMSAVARNRTEEHREKLRLARLGKKSTKETRTKMSESHAGEKCYNWKGGITPVYKHIRGRLEYKRWCAELLKKHNYTDHFTNKRGGVLACHHIIPVNILLTMYQIADIEGALACPLIWDLNNGVVLLKSAHDKFHNLYGDNKNIYELTETEIAELYADTQTPSKPLSPTPSTC